MKLFQITIISLFLLSGVGCSQFTTEETSSAAEKSNIEQNEQIPQTLDSPQQKQQESSNPIQYENYTSQIHSISFDYPLGWNVEENEYQIAIVNGEIEFVEDKMYGDGYKGADYMFSFPYGGIEKNSSITADNFKENQFYEINNIPAEEARFYYTTVDKVYYDKEIVSITYFPEQEKGENFSFAKVGEPEKIGKENPQEKEMFYHISRSVEIVPQYVNIRECATKSSYFALDQS
jgi:hypothetical protein